MTVGCFRVLREMLFRLKLYLFGIRFYEQAAHGKAEVIYEAEYRLDSAHRIIFRFYRIECFEILMKRGELIGEAYPSYAVVAELDPTFPESLRAFSGRRFFFNGRINGFKAPERQTLDLILDVYLDFLRNSFLKHSTVKV